MGIKVGIEIYPVNIGVKCVFFLAMTVVIYAIFWGKLFPKTCVRVKFVTNSMSAPLSVGLAQTTPPGF